MDCFQMNIMWLVIVVMSLAFLTIGIKGVVEKKPFLISSRWMWVLMLVCFGPQIFNSLCFLTDDKHFDWIFVLAPIMLIFLLFFMWRQMCGYMAFGVTDDAFRDALHAALAARSIEYEERLTKVHLKNEKVDLQVSVQSWMGVGQIRIKDGHQETLKGIVAEMNKYFCNNKVTVNLFTCIIDIVLGIMMLVMGAGGWLHFGSKFSGR